MPKGVYLHKPQKKGKDSPYWKGGEGHRPSDSPEWQRTYRLKYAKLYRDKLRVHWRIKESRRRAVKGSFTIEEWNKLKTRFGNKCLGCGRSESEVKLEVDHIVPISKGGTSFIDNLQPLCKACNTHKAYHIKDMRPLGITFEWAIRRRSSILRPQRRKPSKSI